MRASDIRALRFNPAAARLRVAAAVGVAAALCVAASLCGSAAHAQEIPKSSIAAAREVLIAKGAAATFDPVVHGVIEKVKNYLLPTNPNLSGELNDVAQTLHKEYDPKRSEVLDELARAYARHFTEHELKDLTVFYKTPLGQKWAREEPAAIEESIHLVTAWGDNFSEVVMGRFRAEMQKKGHPL